MINFSQFPTVHPQEYLFLDLGGVISTLGYPGVGRSFSEAGEKSID